jgi:hypothetical protein
MRKLKHLEPQQQGHIDGLCSVYAVMNAVKYIFTQEERTDASLFKSICEGNADLFPKIMYEGTETRGVESILKSAQEWARWRHLGKGLVVRPLFRRSKPRDIERYFGSLQEEQLLWGGVFVVGLGKPWNHWTVFSIVGPGLISSFDSWGFPEVSKRSEFTLSKNRAGDDRTLVVVRQTYHLFSQEL